MAKLNSPEYKSFEEIRHVRESGTEYWTARELASALQYAKWENFAKVIDRAMLACKNSGYDITEHFFEVRKAIDMPSKPRKNQDEIGFPEVRKTKDIIDYELTR